MRRVRVALLAGCVGVIVASLCVCGGGGGGDFSFVRDTSDVRGIWLSRDLDALWLRRIKGTNRWQIGEMAPASGQQTRSLLEILGALRLGDPLSTEGTDSLRKGLVGGGLQVLVEYDSRENDSYVLFLPDGRGPCVYSKKINQGWRVDVLGFDEAFIRDLSLRISDWRPFSLGVQRPSDLRAVRLLRHGDTVNSFLMEVGDGYVTRVVSLSDTATPVLCDTARVSVFLHSLTSLRSHAVGAQQQDSVRAWLDTCRADWTLTLQLHSGEEVSYAIARFPQDAGGRAQMQNVGMLMTEGGVLRRITLSDWDVTLLSLSDLRAAN